MPLVARIMRKREYTHPIRQALVRDVEKSGGIAEIDADRGFLWNWPAYGVKQGQSEAAMSRGIDDEICRQCFASPIGVLTPNRGNCCVIRGRDELLCPAALA